MFFRMSLFFQKRLRAFSRCTKPLGCGGELFFPESMVWDLTGTLTAPNGDPTASRGRDFPGDSIYGLGLAPGESIFWDPGSGALAPWALGPWGLGPMGPRRGGTSLWGTCLGGMGPWPMGTWALTPGTFICPLGPGPFIWGCLGPLYGPVWDPSPWLILLPVWERLR